MRRHVSKAFEMVRALPRARQASSSPTFDGTYVVMRQMSGLERDAASANVDLRILREEVEILRLMMADFGIRVIILPADEKSPFSSRIGRYALGVPGNLLLFQHPDGHSPQAHFDLKKYLTDNKVYLPPLNVFKRRQRSTLDARDIIRVGGIYITGMRSEGSQHAVETLHDVVNPDHVSFNSRLLDKGRNAVRGIDLQARGIQTPLCNVLASPDGQSLIVDSSRQDVVRAIQESGITVLGGTIQQAPPYAAQALLFETRNEQDDSAPPLFVPNGFPDVQSFYKQVFRHVEVVPVACTELLKMGAHLREMFLHIIPVQDVFGRYTGAFRDIHRHAPLREKMGKGDASFQYEKDGKPYNHRQSYFPEELTDPYNPFGGLHLPADHPLKKAHDEMSAAFQRRRQSRHFMHQPMYNDTRRNTTPMWQPGESAPETAAEWKRAPVARSNKGGGPL